MNIPSVPLLPVLVSGIVIFILGGAWYSPALFARKWLALMGRSEAEMKAAAASSSMPALYFLAFLCGLATSWTLSVILDHFTMLTAVRGAEVGVLCWIGFAGATSFANAIFSMKPKALWLIDTGFNLVSFILAGIILAVWR